MEINIKTFSALLLTSLMSGCISGCYLVLDDDYGYDSHDSHDSYHTHYGSAPWIDTGDTYWYCEDYREQGQWRNYWEFYTIAGDDDGQDDIYKIEFNVYHYDGSLAFWGDLYSLNTFGGLDEEFYNARTFYYDDFPCNDIYEVEFYVEDWDGNYANYWLY
tara:strand:+ start:288 stop:767 length:480 start_codon:yes stop_codon:yes gene_type:complete